MKGIPQGMSISYILSSFYYASLEDKALNFLKEENKQKTDLNLVMRMTDDYLLMTSSKKNATQFIEKLFAMAAANKFKFNQKKLRTNFPIDIGKLSSLQNKPKLINGSNLINDPFIR